MFMMMGRVEKEYGRGRTYRLKMGTETLQAQTPKPCKLLLLNC